ncbi:hypothetical protein CONPUDRAFT_48460 [Coniophora puteana RWD-64-598 SS2]|uniref:N-acetyltransferase ECO1 n=1 Tax=Coniophora puteana (strain RWD-64-598) TaxID=741705 RepID=A0A5M3N330_CONPW|nr:uncharacterized protein CONPUDRAFT_48460 [Coniophora puteana RWD-64-598 SS2]EIW85434.1 hypothetical protein CONPUDRAFT_48460 [Coniophora puteana RWD-64-598 SS2]
MSSQRALTQLHFSLETSVLRTCPSCGLSYTKGAPDDESLHRAHCIRVQRGMEWGREEHKEVEKANVEEVGRNVVLGDGTKGRIICFRADVGGKIGSKFAVLLETINLTLSSPPLTPEVLKASKAYLFLSRSKGSPSREKIAGCVIAQRISTAMEVASPESSSKPLSDLIPVDPSTSLFVHPEKLPTPMGIPRLFVPTTHRRLGIATRLLSVAARTFVRGCPLDPTKGEIAFTQPTGAGAGVMRAWGKGAARIYEE